MVISTDELNEDEKEDLDNFNLGIHLAVGDPFKTIRPDDNPFVRFPEPIRDFIDVKIRDFIEEDDDISDIMNPFKTKDFANLDKPFVLIPRQELNRNENVDVDDGIEVAEFRTIIDDTFPYQDFSKFRYV